MFSSHCFGYKDLLARDFLDCEGGSFYGPEHSELYKSDSGPSCPVAPSRNIMFISGYLWREFILLIHWPALLQRLEEFDFLFIYSLHFSSSRRLVSCVTPQEDFLPPRRGPLWNEIRERKENERWRTRDVTELLFIVILLLLLVRFCLHLQYRQ